MVKQIFSVNLQDGGMQYYTLTEHDQNLISKVLSSFNCSITQNDIYIFFELHSNRRSRTVFCKKGVLRNFAEFTEKHLCQGLFFDKVAGLGPVLQAFSYRTPLVAASVAMGALDIQTNIFSYFNSNLYCT